jgi:hypothetical protein
VTFDGTVTVYDLAGEPVNFRVHLDAAKRDTHYARVAL